MLIGAAVSVAGTLAVARVTFREMAVLALTDAGLFTATASAPITRSSVVLCHIGRSVSAKIQPITVCTLTLREAERRHVRAGVPPRAAGSPVA